MKQRKPKIDTDRGAKVIKRAVEIMAQGARGWSDALSKAEKEVSRHGSD